MSADKQRREGWFEKIGLELQVLPRLYLDRRMPLWLKLIPLAGLAFLVNPVDFPTVVDDIVVLTVTIVLYYVLAPAKLMEEHRDQLRKQINGEWRDASQPGEKTIDGQFRQEDNYKDQNIGK